MNMEKQKYGHLEQLSLQKFMPAGHSEQPYIAKELRNYIITEWFIKYMDLKMAMLLYLTYNLP